MDEGKRRLVVLGVLLALSVVTALVIELVPGSASASSDGLSGIGGSGSTKSSGKSTKSPSGTGGSNYGSNGSSGSNGSGAAGTLTYRTIGTDVHMRADATTNSAVVVTMHPFASVITASCYRTGQNILGQTLWFQASYGSSHGWVSGYWLDTGHDPSTGILRRC
jgi:hypothetical protein